VQDCKRLLARGRPQERQVLLRGRRTAATDPASAGQGRLIANFAMSLADRGAGSVREIQINSGRESPRARPAIARQHPNISSDEAHIWHT
jgi:hypothetical protein